MRNKKIFESSGRGRGGGGGGGRSAGNKPRSSSDRSTGVYYKRLKDPNATMQTSHQARRFLEGMAAIDSKAKLLAELTDDRNSGQQRIEQVLSFLEDAIDVQDFLSPLLRHGINDETSKPLYKALRDRYLYSIFRVPLVMAFLGSDGVLDNVDLETADIICLFLLYIAKAYGEARASDNMSTVAKKLRDRGDVKDVNTLCCVLLVDEKSRLLGSDKSSSDFMRSSSRDAPPNKEVACWITDRVPPGGRHDNDALNYRDIQVLPTADELRCQVPPFLPLASGENKIIDDPVMHLLDSNFRLLREDAVSTMRESISQRKWPWKNARVVGLDLTVFGSSGAISFIVQIDPPTRTIPDWSKARALMQGTVVAFLDTNAQLVRTGIITIHRDDVSWLRDVGGPKFGVSFGKDSAFDVSMEDMVVNKGINESYVKLLREQEGSQTAKDLLFRMKTFEMIEASKSFFAYEPVLKALQSMDRIPFTCELIELRSHHSNRPTYLPNTVNFPSDENFHGYTCNLVGVPSPQDVVDRTSLDISQAKAVCQALTSRVSLIQGPPGCGKTFIGGLIAQIILSNSTEKIFCVCYTNHALDQFLEHMIDYGETRIVRVGGRSKSEKVAKYQLFDLAKTKARLDDQVSTRIRQLDAQSYKQKDIINAHVAVLKTPVGWDSPHGGVEGVLADAYPNQCDFLSLPKWDDGFTVVGPSGRKGVAKDFLWNAWKGGEGYPIFLLAHRKKMPEDFENFWKMPQDQRLEFVGAIEREVTTIEGPVIRAAVNELSALSREKQELRQEKDLQILRNARVIGATTSGAARYRELLSAIAPGVVIVEEAGEVLEAHVLSALSTETEDTKHLVLIGDHKQLRPKVEAYALSTVSRGGYNLDISLFERLVLGGLPSSRLAVQHRMRPEISRFIRAQTYNDLIDHQSVFKHPDLKGVSNNVVFIDHTIKEDGEDKDRGGYQSNTTKSNAYEATLCIEIVRYFLLQGYGADKIVVLTPYLGQLRNILSVMKTSLKDVEAYISENDLLDLETLGEDPSTELQSQNKEKLRRSHVRVSSVDNFQGEESDIVIVSLVRSNPRGEIGFLKEEQRVNVLLSRARFGMYLVGNSSTLLQSPGGRSTWGPIIDMLQEFRQLKKGLPTVCQLHSDDDSVELCTPEEFRTLRPNGGCLRKCDFRLPCGHVCPQMCNPTDRSHEYASSVCHEPCMRVPPKCKMGHRCTKPCKFDCGRCETNVGPMELTCGHVAKTISCHDTRTPEVLEQFTSKCKELVEAVMPACGHTVETFCGNANSETPACPAKCGHMMAVCNHPCENR
jgi:hypothetical protein